MSLRSNSIMTFTEIIRHRFVNQQIGKGQFGSAKELVTWMGAMQAQDLNMVKWAIGLRLASATEKSVEDAIDRGEIIRTHVLRPTWHIIPADDLHWMLKLTAPYIRSSMNTRHRQLEITPEIIKKCYRVIRKRLSGKACVTREELVNGFENAGIINKDNRAAHLLMLAELDGIICSGPLVNNSHTYTLIEKRVPAGRQLDRPDSLTELAYRYFASHGPATLDDFTWWSGLPLRDTRSALEGVKQNLESITIDSKVYWFQSSGNDFAAADDQAFLLPAYDEFIISYKDKKAILTDENHLRTVASNGFFRPIIIANEMVIGVWKRTIIKDKVTVEPKYFKPVPKKNLLRISEKFMDYGNFLEKEIKIS